MPQASEYGEVSFPFGEVIQVTGKNRRALELLLDNPYLHEEDLAAQLWEKELNHRNRFLRVSLEEALHSSDYLPKHLGQIRRQLPPRYVLDRTKGGLVFLREGTWFTVPSQVLPQIQYLIELGFHQALGLNPDQYLKTFPPLSETPGPSIQDRQIMAVVIDPRVNLSTQLDLQKVLNKTGVSIDSLTTNDTALTNLASAKMPYVIYASRGMQYTGGYDSFLHSRLPQERPLTLMEGAGLTRACEALGIRRRRDYRLVAAGSSLITEAPPRTSSPYFMVNPGSGYELGLVSRASRYRNYSYASAFGDPI